MNKLFRFLLAGVLPLGPWEVSLSALDEDYYRHLPGTEWSTLIPAFWGNRVVRAPDGYVIVTRTEIPGEEHAVESTLIRLNERGEITARIQLPETGSPSPTILDLAFHPGPGGSESGFSCVGLQADRTWMGTIDLEGNLTWKKKLELHGEGRVLAATFLREEGNWLVGSTVRPSFPSRGLLGGTLWCPDYEKPPRPTPLWTVLTQVNAEGEVLQENWRPWGWCFKIIPAGDGGHLLATAKGIKKINPAGELQWEAQKGPELLELEFDAYFDAVVAADGSIFAVGTIPSVPSRYGYAWVDPQFSVAARFAPDGALIWRENFGAEGKWNELSFSPYVSGGNRNGAFTRAVALPEGGCLAVGFLNGPGSGRKRLQIVNFSAEGTMKWDLVLGREGSVRGRDLLRTADGGSLVLADVTVDEESYLWLFKLRADLRAPEAAFAVTTPLPAFSQQEISFDSSASTAGSGEIIWRRWDFGDGTLEENTVAPVHAYAASGIYPVTLTLENSDGIRQSVTHEVDVVGTEVQWERHFGDSISDQACGLIASADGGFVLAGTQGGQIWVHKTDAAGHPVWTRFFDRKNDHGNHEGTQAGRSIIPAHDGGCLVAATDDYYDSEVRRWRRNVWLLKLDEAGELVWPEIKVFGESAFKEEATSLAPTAEGGYLIAGATTVATDSAATYPWLVKTDGAGETIWSSFYNQGYGGRVTSVVEAPDGGIVYLVENGASPFHVVKLTGSGTPLWDQSFAAHDTGNWIGLRDPPADGFALVGVLNRDIGLQWLDPEGVPEAEFSWTGCEERRWTDIGRHATRTPDGGWLLTGTAKLLRDGHGNNDLALVKTDAAAHTEWVEFFPRSKRIQETGIASVALEDGSIVVLGSRNTPSPIWLFKIARNHPPRPRFTITPRRAQIGQRLLLDGSASRDSDGEVVAWKWYFDDGSEPVTGCVTNHVFHESGVREIRLVVVDDQGAERVATNVVTVSGIKNLGAELVMEAAEVVPDPASDREQFPRSGAVPGLIWENSRGFRLQVHADSATLRTFRVTYKTPLPERFKLYLLPDWAEVPYTIIDAYTLEIRRHIGMGETSLAFVLGPSMTIPPRRLLISPVSNPWLLALHFGTKAEAKYQVESTRDLGGEWTPEPHSPRIDRLPNFFEFTGDGENATLYVNRPPDAPAVFFRLRITEPPEEP
jgi:PKD repeat protein